MSRRLLVVALIFAAAVGGTAAHAQELVAPERQRAPQIQMAPHVTNALTLQPVSVILGLYSAEYEHVTSPSTTVGVGGSYFNGFPGDNSNTFKYLSSEAKVRYYPGARPFQGFSFGGTLGFVRVSDTSTRYDINGLPTGSTSESQSGVKAGFELDYGWLLGAQQKFVVALGAGAKRLFIKDFSSNGGNNVTAAYPTLRISVGFAF